MLHWTQLLEKEALTDQASCTYVSCYQNLEQWMGWNYQAFPSHDPVVWNSELDDEEMEEVWDSDMDDATVVWSVGSEDDPCDIFDLDTNLRASSSHSHSSLTSSPWLIFINNRFWSQLA